MGYKFQLYTRESTVLTKTVEKAVDMGEIVYNIIKFN